MIALLFILTCVFVFAATWLFEGKEDYWMFIDSSGNQKWKIWGNLHVGAYLAAISALVTLCTKTPWYCAIILLAIYLIVWNTAHDWSIGWYLKKNIFYLGSKGWDAWIKKTFGSRGWCAYKLVAFIVLTGAYFSLCLLF